MFSCTYCSRDFSNPGGKGAHEPYCQINPQRKQRKRSALAGRKKGAVPWNKGMVGDPRMAKEKGKRFGASLHGHTAATKARLSDVAKERGLGGYIRGSGRGKKGWYKGHWCDSSYELAWIIYQLDHGYMFTRNTAKFAYEWEGKTRNWIPDFILANGCYVEIKGYETPQTRAKFVDFPHDLVVIKAIQMQPYLKYVIDTYGKDFVRLYGTDGC